MAINNTGMTRRKITPADGQAAFLPNQPILHTCVVSAKQTGNIVCGDIVTIDATNAVEDLITVKKAAVTDEPIGIVALNPIKTGFKANDRISIFPLGSFVYKTTGAANLAAGSKLGFNANGEVIAATAEKGVIGKAMTGGTVTGDIIAIQVLPSVEPAEPAEPTE